MSLRSQFALLSGLLALAVAPAAALAQPAAEFLAASEAELENPHDLKLSPDGGALFVSDVGNDRVVILDPESLALLGSFGADHQAGTHDVDFDAEGRALIADTRSGRILIYRMEGLEATLVGELSERLRGPEGVLSHPNGRIYAAGAWSGNVVAFEEGRLVGELTGLSSPHDLELAPDGSIWLADAGNDRMLLLSPELEILRELKGPPYDFDGVRYQDLRPDGTLVVADKNNHQVKVIGPDGELVLVLGEGTAGRGPGLFTTPEGIELQGDTLWVSDSGNDRVVKYRMRWE